MSAPLEDPVRLYLREMGSVPLLTREGEVVIAKRIERGQRLMLKTISRSPIVMKELMATGKQLAKGGRSIKEILHFDQDELTEEDREKKTEQISAHHRANRKALREAVKQADKLERMPKSNKRAAPAGFSATLARTRIEMSRLVRSIEFHPLGKEAPGRPHAAHGRALMLSAGSARSGPYVCSDSWIARGNVLEARKELRSRREEMRADRETPSNVGLTALKRSLTLILRGEAEAEAGEEGTDGRQIFAWSFRSRKNTPTAAWNFST